MIPKTDTVKITNSNGDSIEFGRHFRLIDGLDLSALTAQVNYAESTADGAHYQNTKLDVREFDVGFFINKDLQENWWMEERRQELFKVLNPKHNPMVISFDTKGGQSFYVNANIASAPSLPQGWENDNAVWQKGLLQFICTDPYIYDAASQKVDIALWVGAFEFPLEIVEGGIEMGYRSPSLIVNANNDGQESTGMIIRFVALSTVVNPKLLNVNTYEELKLNTTMLPGDVIEVSTYRGKRGATLMRSNTKTNVFSIIDLSSTFLQLEVGDNLFRYDADSGLDYLEVSMNFTPRRIGV